MVNEKIKRDVTSAKSVERTELSRTLRTYLSDVLNEVHDMDASERFWALIIQTHVRAMISRKPHLENKKSTGLPDLYPINSFSEPTRKQKLKQNLILLVKHARSRWNTKSIRTILEQNDDFRLGFPEIPVLSAGELGVKLPEYIPLFFGKGDRRKRERVNEIANRIENHFISNAVRELPMILVEHFTTIYDQIETKDAENKRFHIHLDNSFFYQVLISAYAEDGATVYWYQHGCEYGEFREDTDHNFELSICDKYRTWGWKYKEKDQPWKAYRLEHFKLQYDKHKNNFNHDLLLCYPELNYKNKPFYVEWSNFLLQSLDPVKYSGILARPRRSNKIQSHRSQLAFIDDARVTKSSGLKHISEEMSHCMLILQMNVPSTNFLECIYVDHPTMGILNNDRPTDIVKPFYDFFKKNGVLHDDIESLVAHLNRIDPDRWWSRLIEEDMYKLFKNTFTRKAELIKTDER